MIERTVDMVEDKFFHKIKSKVEVERSEKCFERVRENIRIILSFSEEFSSRELDDIRHMESLCYESEVASPDKR